MFAVYMLLYTAGVAFRWFRLLCGMLYVVRFYLLSTVMFALEHSLATFFETIYLELLWDHFCRGKRGRSSLLRDFYFIFYASAFWRHLP